MKITITIEDSGSFRLPYVPNYTPQEIEWQLRKKAERERNNDLDEHHRLETWKRAIEEARKLREHYANKN